jgi:hypothetical protein
MTLGVSEYQSQILWPLERLELVQALLNVLAQIVVAESHALARRIPTQCYPHSSNTFPVSVYQNYTVTTTVMNLLKISRPICRFCKLTRHIQY